MNGSAWAETARGPTITKCSTTATSFGRLFESAGFQVELLEYFDAGGNFTRSTGIRQPGKIHRSRRFDERNRDGRLDYTSVILDARKPH